MPDLIHRSYISSCTNNKVTKPTKMDDIENFSKDKTS